LSGDESVDVGVGKHLARAFRAVTDGHVTERADGDMAEQRFDGAVQLGGSLSGGFEPVR